MSLGLKFWPLILGVKKLIKQNIEICLLHIPSNLDTNVSLSVEICCTTKGAKSSTVTAARALSPDATVLSK